MGKNYDLMSGSAKEVMDTTTNDSVYRKARKRWLETGAGELCCSYCRYHRGENRKAHYGGWKDGVNTEKERHFRYPSWKLASKNRKQWMPKNYCSVVEKKIMRRRWDMEYTWIDVMIGNERGLKFAKFYKR